jgi:hypothetical protein
MKQGFFTKGDRTVVITEQAEGFRTRLYLAGRTGRSARTVKAKSFKGALRQADRLLKS